jgi:molybdopterin converting factor small subunit
MPQVTIPRMLADLVGGERSIEVEGGTVGEAVAALCARHPTLRVHLFDESGALREHVRCFRNDRSTGFAETTAASDRITILQAVSGG